MAIKVNPTSLIDCIRKASHYRETLNVIFMDRGVLELNLGEFILFLFLNYSCFRAMVHSYCHREQNSMLLTVNVYVH